MKKIIACFRSVSALALALWIFAPGPNARAAGFPLSLEYFEEKGRDLTIEKVLAENTSLPWRPLLTQNPRFGYTKSRYWFRFRIPPASLHYGHNEPVLLEIPYAYFSKIGFYTAIRGRVVRASFAGMGVNLRDRGINTLRMGKPFFRIPGPQSAEAEYLISIESEFPLALPLRLLEMPDFGDHWRTTFGLGTFFGLLLLAAFFNAFLALSLRSRMYGCYSAFVVFLSLLYFGHEGLSVQFWWPNSSWWALREMHVWGGMALIFYAFFVRDFLQTRRNTPVLDRILFTLVAISSVRMVWLMFGPNQTVAMLGELAVTLTNALVLVISLVALSRGVRTARYFLAASLAFNLGMVFFVLHVANVITVGEFINYAPHVGTAAEVILLSLALADRIRLGNRELADQRAAMILSDKLSALGRMAGEIAHEINNPLAIIHANAVLLREHAGQMPGGKFNWVAVATTIEQTTNRIAKLVKGMRALSRDCSRDPISSASLSTILQDSVSLCEERYARSGVALEVADAGRDPLLRCRSSDVCQVIVNLLHNALDAVEQAPDKAVKLEAELHDGFVELAVVDSGGGVQAEHRKRIMEPFFTTKDPGRGLGLGLSISRTIVESHGGKLWLDETSLRTRFAFTIPVEAEG